MRALITILTLSLFSTVTFADVDSLRAEANAAAAAGETELATSKLQQLLELSPNDGAAHYQSGILLMDNDGSTQDAIEHFERARDLEFQVLGVAYRLSRLFARNGRTDEALEQMEIMAEGGFGFLGLVENQADYDSIKTEPRFDAALASIRAARFPCSGDERHRAFDFWIGEWTVTQNGQFAGNSSIQPILGHCTIFEQWESAAGTSGKSFNYYDPGHDHWRQIWIGDNGSFIEFTGEARDGGIFYTAETIDPANGSVTHHKFEFTVISVGGKDGVRQYWETSTDGGETWQTIWDGHYEAK